MVVEEEFEEGVDVAPFRLETLRHRDANDSPPVDLRHIEGRFV